ncbi:MAG TPA: ATP synthase F1 subunit gamma [Ktedonobacteraceae bacterium]|nr:ATP synthase F1 subunit gamma [Ktedonobacteraceae bacterium]
MSIREIKKHIRTTKEIVRITNVMYLLAASRLAKVRIRSKHGLWFYQEILRLVTIASTHAKKKDSNLLVQRPIRNMLYIVVTPNQGFCGGLPSNLNRLAAISAEEMQNHIAKETSGILPTIAYLTIGKKGREYITRTNRNLIKDVTNTEPTWSLAIEITQIIVELFQREEFDAVFIVYAQSELTMPRPVVEKLLPINLSLVAEQEPPRIGTHVDRYSKEYILYFFAPEVELIFPDLVLKFLACKIYVALLEGAKSENTARMIAMKHATDRAKEILDQLSVVYNVARQAQITADLLEITSAAEALQGEHFP